MSAILAQFPTHLSLETHLDQMKLNPPDASFLMGKYHKVQGFDWHRYQKDMWTDWAKARRPMRTSIVLFALLGHADRNITTEYGILNSAIGTSMIELTNLLYWVAVLCRENGWPLYPILVKNHGTKKVGPGFFTFFDPKLAPTYTDADRDMVEGIEQERCFTTPLPDSLTVANRLNEFALKIGWL